MYKGGGSATATQGVASIVPQCVFFISSYYPRDYFLCLQVEGFSVPPTAVSDTNNDEPPTKKKKTQNHYEHSRITEKNIIMNILPRKGTPRTMMKILAKNMRNLES